MDPDGAAGGAGQLGWRLDDLGPAACAMAIPVRRTGEHTRVNARAGALSGRG